MEYGPWSIVSILFEKNGTHILATSDNRWVLKVIRDSQRSTDELSVLLGMLRNKPRHCITVPTEAYSLYGRTPTSGWYALKRYNGHVNIDRYCKERWRTLATNVLKFLQDFHHNQGLVHMDIKKGNILIDDAKGEFIVADYEHAEKPSTILTMSHEDDYKWYYMGLGAEMNEPLASWRFDLVALGYILASLTVDLAQWTFEEKCWNKRGDKQSNKQEEQEIVALRTKELALADPAIIEYMRTIGNSVSWIAKEPPPREFYVSLERLFQKE